jgi:hypothetical protein
MYGLENDFAKEILDLATSHNCLGRVIVWKRLNAA